MDIPTAPIPNLTHIAQLAEPLSPAGPPPRMNLPPNPPPPRTTSLQRKNGPERLAARRAAHIHEQPQHPQSGQSYNQYRTSHGSGSVNGTSFTQPEPFSPSDNHLRKSDGYSITRPRQGDGGYGSINSLQHHNINGDNTLASPTSPQVPMMSPISPASNKGQYYTHLPTGSTGSKTLGLGSISAFKARNSKGDDWTSSVYSSESGGLLSQANSLRRNGSGRRRKADRDSNAATAASSLRTFPLLSRIGSGASDRKRNKRVSTSTITSSQGEMILDAFRCDNSHVRRGSLEGTIGRDEKQQQEWTRYKRDQERYRQQQQEEHEKHRQQYYRQLNEHKKEESVLLPLSYRPDHFASASQEHQSPSPPQQPTYSHEQDSYDLLHNPENGLRQDDPDTKRYSQLIEADAAEHCRLCGITAPLAVGLCEDCRYRYYVPQPARREEHLQDQEQYHEHQYHPDPHHPSSTPATIEGDGRRGGGGLQSWIRDQQREGIKYLHPGGFVSVVEVNRRHSGGSHSIHSSNVGEDDETGRTKARVWRDSLAGVVPGEEEEESQKVVLAFEQGNQYAQELRRASESMGVGVEQGTNRPHGDDNQANGDNNGDGDLLHAPPRRTASGSPSPSLLEESQKMSRARVQAWRAVTQEHELPPPPPSTTFSALERGSYYPTRLTPSPLNSSRGAYAPPAEPVLLHSRRATGSSENNVGNVSISGGRKYLTSRRRRTLEAAEQEERQRQQRDRASLASWSSSRSSFLLRGGAGPSPTVPSKSRYPLCSTRSNSPALSQRGYTASNGMPGVHAITSPDRVSPPPYPLPLALRRARSRTESSASRSRGSQSPLHRSGSSLRRAGGVGIAEMTGYSDSGRGKLQNRIPHISAVLGPAESDSGYVDVIGGRKMGPMTSTVEVAEEHDAEVRNRGLGKYVRAGGDGYGYGAGHRRNESGTTFTSSMSSGYNSVSRHAMDHGYDHAGYDTGYDTSYHHDNGTFNQHGNDNVLHNHPAIYHARIDDHPHDHFRNQPHALSHSLPPSHHINTNVHEHDHAGSESNKFASWHSPTQQVDYHARTSSFGRWEEYYFPADDLDGYNPDDSSRGHSRSHGRGSGRSVGGQSRSAGSRGGSARGRDNSIGHSSSHGMKPRPTPGSLHLHRGRDSPASSRIGSSPCVESSEVEDDAFDGFDHSYLTNGSQDGPFYLENAYSNSHTQHYQNRDHHNRDHEPGSVHNHTRTHGRDSPTVERGWRSRPQFMSLSSQESGQHSSQHCSPQHHSRQDHSNNPRRLQSQSPRNHSPHSHTQPHTQSHTQSYTQSQRSQSPRSQEPPPMRQTTRHESTRVSEILNLYGDLDYGFGSSSEGDDGEWVRGDGRNGGGVSVRHGLDEKRLDGDDDVRVFG